MLQVHREGMGVCGTYMREVAAAKVDQVIDLARQAPAPAAVHDGGDLSVKAYAPAPRIRGAAHRGERAIEMIAQELEVSLHMAFVEARQKQHEFITVEHLLLAMLDNPSAAEVLKACGVDLDELRGVLTDFISEHTPRLLAALGRRHAADARLPARDPARDPARPVVGQEGSHRRQRAGRDLRREGIARRLLPEPARRDAARRRQLHRARHHQEPAAEARRRARRKEDGEGGSEAQGALEAYTINLNTMAKQGKTDPLIGREHELERVDPGAVPPPQEQSAARRRGRRGQDRDRRRARAPDQRGRSARAAARTTRSTRSTWARCSPAPSTAAISSSA